MGVNIDFIKINLLGKYPSFGKTIANLKFIENESIATAGTDGKVVLYNPVFVESLTIKEQVFLFAHEICHVALNHVLRSKDKNRRIWNIATDSVINAWLVKDNLPLIQGGIDIPEAIEHDSEEMYQMMINEYEKMQQEKESEQNDLSEQNDSQENMSDQNESSQEQEDSNDQESKQNNNKENVNKKSDSSQQENNEDIQETNVDLGETTEGIKQKIRNYLEDMDSEKSTIGHDSHDLWEKALDENQEQIDEEKSISDKDIFDKNKKMREKEQEDFERKMIEEASKPVNDPNSILKSGRRVTNIGIARPLINWKRLLKEAIKYNEEFTRKNARIRDGVFKYRIEEIPINEAEIILDTSGSISPEILKNFLRECRYVINEARVKVGCFDTRFYGFTEISDYKDIEQMEFPGGGATDFNVAVEAFSRNVPNKIIFTDGEAPIPKKKVNAIWIVMGDKEIKPKGGKVIHITGKQLQELNKCKAIKRSNYK